QSERIAFPPQGSVERDILFLPLSKESREFVPIQKITVAKNARIRRCNHTMRRIDAWDNVLHRIIQKGSNLIPESSSRASKNSCLFCIARPRGASFKSALA